MIDLSRLTQSSVKGVRGAGGSLVFADRVGDVAFKSTVRLGFDDGRELLGQVIDLSRDVVVIQVLGSTHGLQPAKTSLRYGDTVFKLPLSPLMLGRVLDGKGKPIDGLPPYPARMSREINSGAINPVARDVPDQYLETGVSSLDLMNTLVKGQKLPIFSCAGLPANELASFIVQSASAPQRGNGAGQGDAAGGGDLVVVFAGMGVTHRDVNYFLDSFRAAGVMDRTVVFLNRADEPVIERLMAPRCALTAAEYFAFELHHDVLVILTDMIHYCEALREVASALEEIAGRRGYPGYMYTDLATIYERAGRIEGMAGSITQLPIVTMPDDDITHPVPDLTGYVTEGQIVLDRALHRKGVWPPVNPLPSLSRLMDKVAGKSTHKGHKKVSDQLYSLYARAVELRRMAELVGADNLSPAEREILEFGDEFEHKMLDQQEGARTLSESISTACGLLKKLSPSNLDRISTDELNALAGGMAP